MTNRRSRESEIRFVFRSGKKKSLFYLLSNSSLLGTSLLPVISYSDHRFIPPISKRTHTTYGRKRLFCVDQYLFFARVRNTCVRGEKAPRFIAFPPCIMSVREREREREERTCYLAQCTRPYSRSPNRQRPSFTIIARGKKSPTVGLFHSLVLQETSLRKRLVAGWVAGVAYLQTAR